MMKNRKLTRRTTLKTGATALAGLTGLAGCTGAVEDLGGDGESTTLRIATDADPSSPLNIYVSSGSSFDWLKDLVYDRLLAPSPYVEDPMPGLATETTRVDGTTWTATVRSDATWHDGEPFTADDVVFTYRYFRDAEPNRYTHHVSDAPEIETIEAVDDETVRFECAYPAPTLADITFADLPILPAHIWESVDDPYTYAEYPVGTGPYELVDYEAGERLRFVANDDYFGGAPLVDELLVPIIKDHSTIFTALETGEVDTANVEIPPEAIDRFESSESVDVVRTDWLSLVEIRINYEREPFDQHAFRGAVSGAIDREAITETVTLGMARPGVEGYPHPESPWTAPDLSTPYNPESARATLDELGFTDDDGDGVRETAAGDPLSFSLKVASNQPTWIRAAEMVAADLLEVGIDVEVRTLDPGSIGSLFGSRDFDMYVSDISPHGVADPDQFVMSHRSGYLWRNDIDYPEWDALYDEWRQTTTVEARKEVLFEMQRLFNSQPTSLVLWYPEPRWGYDPEAHGAWAESPGFGIHHKWSLLPEDERGTAVTRSFD
ncbi:putative extracellular solute-binding protein, family 5 [Haloferax sp. ATCC BAA-645]|nr:putative extracellular solute-binding protein, family 5 [Haloferax sp. ATCC BAA-645]